MPANRGSTVALATTYPCYFYRDCGENAATVLDTITQHAVNEEQRLIKIEATPLHKMTIKVKHGRIPPFAVYMGPKIPGIRMIALNVSM